MNNRPMRSGRHPFRSRRPGFTLIELLIAVAVIAILGAIAYPSFMDSIRKGRRADAVAALTQVQHAQERFRANHSTYAGSFDPTGANPDKLALRTTSPEGHYSLTLRDATMTGYVAEATARSDSPQASDAACRVMRVTLDDRNGVIQHGSTSSDNTTNSSAVDPCWVK
jgi:type IV pilus assembly protein PilE